MSTSITSGNQLSNYHGFTRKGLLEFLNTTYLARGLSDTNFLNQLANAFTDKAQYINSIKWYPFNVSAFTTLRPIESLKLGGIVVNDPTTQPVVPVAVKKFDEVLRKVEVARIVIPRHYNLTINSFLDFEPYTRMQIYLPFLGYYDLPVNECMGLPIIVSYAVDFDTGIATAYVEVEYDSDHDPYVVLTATGKVGIDIPIGSTNANEVAKRNFENSAKLLASGVALVGGVMTGNVVGGMLAVSGLTTAISSGVDAVTSQQKHYNRGTISGGQDAICSPRSVFVLINRTKPVDIDNQSDYINTKGLPLCQMRNLYDIPGFAIVEKIHLEGFSTALKSEVDEIESLLHEGVIL